MKSDSMPTSLILSAVSGVAIGLLYALLFKKQTKSIFEGLVGQQTPGKAKAIARHLMFLATRFIIIIGLIFGLKLTGFIDLQVCCIFVVCGFLISLLMHTKRML